MGFIHALNYTLMELLEEIEVISKRQRALTKVQVDAHNSEKYAHEILTLPTKKALPVHKSRYTWILDAGHGPATMGKRSPWFIIRDKDGKEVDRWQLREYEFNDDVLNRVGIKLSYYGIDWVRTIPLTEDLDDSIKNLNRRVDAANKVKGPAFFISIHANAHGSGKIFTEANGSEVWYYYKSSKGLMLAKYIQENLVKKLGTRDRGIQTNTNTDKAFYVLRKTIHPAVLVEAGFMTNLQDCQKLRTDWGREQVADAIVETILMMEGIKHEQAPV